MATTPETITPYDSADSKTEQVERMFDSIAPAYDFMNRAMTLGIDRRWRRKAVEMVAATCPKAILDVATGTADFALQLARSMPEATITGIDLSEEMLTFGRRKVEQARLTDRIELRKADCLALPMPTRRSMPSQWLSACAISSSLPKATPKWPGCFAPEGYSAWSSLPCQGRNSCARSIICIPAP